VARGKGTLTRSALDNSSGVAKAGEGQQKANEGQELETRHAGQNKSTNK
jgi:hypothetical protein